MPDPDRAFADPRLAVLYDVLDGDRSDLDSYLAVAVDVGATRVLDVGCGTGSLAVRLAGLDMHVVALDPARASLDVARSKPLSDRVEWVHGEVAALAGLEVAADLAVMTGNVAQVFLSDEDWRSTLGAVHDCLRPDGWFVFETRRPEARDWERWDMPPTPVPLPDGTTVVVSKRVTDVALPLVSFEATTVVGGEVLTSASTLRFRQREEVELDLAEVGFVVVEVRDAPDRPGKELVFLARRIAPAAWDHG